MMSASRWCRAVLGVFLLFLSIAVPTLVSGSDYAAGSSTDPNFYIEPHVPVATVYQGADPLGHVFVFVYSNAYFSGWVNLTLAVTPNLENGPIIYLSRPNIYMIPAVSYDSIAMIGAYADTPLSSYNVTVTAVGGDLTRTTSFTVTVIPPLPPPDFTIALWPSSSTLQPGFAQGVTVAVDRVVIHEINEINIVLSLDIYPHGALESSGFPSQLTVTYQWDGIRMTFIVSSTSSAPPGTYTLTVTGTEPALSHSRTGWKPAVTHAASAVITVGDTYSYATTRAPLLYELGFSGSAYPGEMMSFVSKFTNQGAYAANVTGLLIRTDFGLNVRVASGLPLVVGPGETTSLFASVTLPSTASLGSHLVTATVEWKSADPYFMQGGWSRSPVVFPVELVVGETYAEDGGPAGSNDAPPEPPRSPLGLLRNQIMGRLGPVAVLGFSAYLALVAVAVVLVVRSDRAKRRRLLQG